jgi:hypothetical protein
MPKMSDTQVHNLAMNLLNADSEEGVVQILESVSLWSDPGLWRLLGDDENNFKTVGAQHQLGRRPSHGRLHSGRH